MVPWVIFLAVLLCAGTEARTKRSLRFVTWNVGDNQQMGGGINDRVVRQLLGLESLHKSQKGYFDVYAISLQENCYLCNSNNGQRLAEVFVKALNKERKYQYELIGQMATRVSSTCETVACNTGQHGTTVMIVIAKKGMASLLSTFHTNKCAGGWIKNAEKGIAAVKFQLREGGGPTVCVGGLHLDSESPAERRDCFKDFTHEHRAQLNGCHVTFFAGDYNTRTGDKGGNPTSHSLNDNQVRALKDKDEMIGRQPYGGQRLIDYISKVIGKSFSEAPLSFYPTYSLKSVKECKNKWPCFRGDRPPSWTDRIVCSPCTSTAYFSLPMKLSDHSPVIGIYQI